MDAKDFFINLFIAILIVLIVSYLFSIIGWMNISNNCSYTSPTGFVDDSKLKTCLDDINNKQNIINLKRSIVAGILGVALLFNTYYIDLKSYGAKGDINLGLSIAGLYFILMSITEYLQYLPDIFKFISLLIVLFFVLKIYLTQNKA